MFYSGLNENFRNFKGRLRNVSKSKNIHSKEKIMKRKQN